MKILASLEKQNVPFLVFSGFILIGLIGFIDYETGRGFAFAVFYVFPISIVTWFGNRQLGLLASVIGAAVWFGADIVIRQDHSLFTISFWNFLIRVAYFMIITFLLSSLKKSLALARTDHLTSAINSRYFYEILQMEMDRFQRYQRPFTVVYIDVDNFKIVNDHFGHAVGNQVLIALVHSIKNTIRKSDVIARLGGDEFAILFPETDQQSARIILSKIRQNFLEVTWSKKMDVTFSIGVLTCNAAMHTTDELIRMADELMYSAKSEGKNTAKYSFSRTESTPAHAQ